MSTALKHTPGPWRHETIKVKEFEQIGVRRKMFGADGQLMLWQEPYFKNPFDRLYDVVRLSDADWPLISAAPEMFEALKRILPSAISYEMDNSDTFDADGHIAFAEAAIAKAEGRVQE